MEKLLPQDTTYASRRLGMEKLLKKLLHRDGAEKLLKKLLHRDGAEKLLHRVYLIFKTRGVLRTKTTNGRAQLSFIRHSPQEKTGGEPTARGSTARGSTATSLRDVITSRREASGESPRLRKRRKPPSSNCCRCHPCGTARRARRLWARDG